METELGNILVRDLTVDMFVFMVSSLTIVLSIVVFGIIKIINFVIEVIGSHSEHGRMGVLVFFASSIVTIGVMFLLTIIVPLIGLVFIVAWPFIIIGVYDIFQFFRSNRISDGKSPAVE
jgi:uncharacterized membrane protein HdeD (DUF308 family)